LGQEGELEVFRHVLQTFPTGTVACVSDSYNIFRACEEYWGGALKDLILNRKGTLVIRPDSGDPVKTLLSIFEILFKQFGYTINAKGYKVLPPQLRVIQGDGVNYEGIQIIYAALKQNGISAENLVLGMGGALLQRVDRDTQRYAIKCSAAIVNGREINVEKHPIEMDSQGRLTESFKKSKAGKLKLVKINSAYRTVNINELPDAVDQLQTVFENGILLKDYDFAELRSRLNDR
jgi:nicotinamide phosphoribosyltransferase